MTTVYADAYGFNASDATAALQAAIDSGADKVIVSNKGTPWLISTTINLKSNQEIDFAPDVIVQAKPGSFVTYNNPLFKALGVNNVKLIGQGMGARQTTLKMNKDASTSDSQHIIAIQGTDNYTISGLTLTGANSDGIIIDAYSTGQPIPVPNTLNYSDRGLIDNVTVTNSNRNGLAVISAQNLTVTNSKFNNSSTSAPASGIDFEPDFSYDRLININISNVDLSGNQGNGVDFNLNNLDNSSAPISITINGATVNNNQSSGIKVETYPSLAFPNSNDPRSTPNGVINISNVTIAGTTETNTFDDVPNAAISVQALSGDRNDPNNLKVNFSNIVISDTGFNTANPQLSANPISIRGFGGAENRNQIGNLSFNNVTVADNYNRAIVGIEINQPGSLNNITGNIRGINPNGVTADITPATATETRNNFTLTVTSGISRNDFNGDGKSDILWRNENGNIAQWQMDGATVTTGSLTSIPSIDPSWKVTGTGDFNGDGKADLLWRNINGSIAVWAMDGATVKSSSLTSTPLLDNSWKVAGTGDYNGDGKADILWRNDFGSVAVWAMDGATVKSSSLTSTPALNSSWKVAGNSDFNGDGKSDILWRNDDGSVALWQMNGAGVTAATAVAKVSADWKIAGTGDFTGDGKSDILWRNDNGTIALWQMNGATLVSASQTSTPSLDSSWNAAGIGDYNGDGKSDILWRNTGGAAVVWTMNGATVVSSTLTSAAADANAWKVTAPII
jgi:FG-GAP-like repeat/Right handed beta helix region